jgi:hypothetical protein
MQNDHYLRDMESRILHVVQQVQELQRELNYLVDEGADDPAVGRVVEVLPELKSIRALQMAVDHLRYFLWCLLEFVPDSPEDTASAGAENKDKKLLPDNLQFLSDAELITLFCNGKSRKPN